MAKAFSPKFVTETDQPPPWLDCTWASGLMLANMASLGKYPATRAERRALRNDSTDHLGGSGLHDLARGLQVRYHWTISADGLSWPTLLAELGNGSGAIVQGIYADLPKHYQRWDTQFAAKGRLSTHAAYAQGHDRGGNYHRDAQGNLTDIFWCDPLGRHDVGTPAADQYRGEWMPVAALHSFMRGLAGDGDLFTATVAQGQHR